MARKKKEVTLQVTPDKSTSKTQIKVKNNNEWPRFEELDEEQLDIVLKYTQKFAHHFKTNSHKVDLNMLKKICTKSIERYLLKDISFQKISTKILSD